MTLRRTIGLAALALGLWTASPTALAQTEAELERARARFAEGVELTQEERWVEAAAAFREVLAVRSTPQVRFNLGLALAHTDAIGEAAELLAEAADSRELDRRTRRNARRELAQLEPRLGTLTVRLSGDEAGVQVTLDGATLGLDRIGRPIRVEAGDHALRASRGTRVVAEEPVSVEVGGESAVTLDLGAAVATTTDVLDPELLGGEDEPADEGGDVTGEWWFWTAIAAAAVLVVGGVVLGVALASEGPQPFSGNLGPGTLEVMP